MVWKELKNFCNSLDEEQLTKEVVIWREDESVSDLTPLILDEDHFIDQEDSENGCFPESEIKNFDPIEIGEMKLKKVYDKGDPILGENF